MRLKSKAFTLVEILLVSSLTAILGAAVFRSFSNGLKLWAKVDHVHKAAEVAIFLDKMAEDLRAATSSSGLIFKGTQTQVSFPAIVMIKADSKSSRISEGVVDQIGAVRYRFDADQHIIFRRQANYSQALKNRWSEDEMSIAVGVKELDFRYEIVEGNKLSFKSEINRGVPLGIMVTIRFNDDAGEHQMKRYLVVPIGK